MDKIFIRNYTLFSIALALCAGGLIYILIAGEKDVQAIDKMAARSYEIIRRSERLGSLVETMLASQRGFIISRDPGFQNDYAAAKNAVAENINYLSIGTDANNPNLLPLDDLKTKFDEFSTKLEEQSGFHNKAAADFSNYNTQIIKDLEKSILDTNISIVNAEYKSLSQHIISLQNRKKNYFTSLLIGIVVVSAFLLLFNGFLLKTKSWRSQTKNLLKDKEERFRLAIKGTNDGIFDWNLQTRTLFWSPQFKRMLGYKEKELVASEEAFEQLLHADDIDHVNKIIGLYITRQLSEFSVIFRMRHKSGRFLWINARGKAVFDKDGRATRMVGAYTDISAIKDYERQLEEAKIQAEKANEAKSDFLAHMSHEIRTPLTAISGIAEIFERNLANLNEKQTRLVSTLSSSTSALKDLINDILDFSKIESGELELKEERFALAQFFDEVTGMMALRAQEKKIEFSFDYADIQEMHFYGDIMRLRQILVNLIGNALKFTEIGSVRVKAYIDRRPGKEFLKIDVTDTGIGILPENADLIFERFKQADASVSRKYGGTGLGLPISKNLARLMGGDIFLDSEIGRGSVFSVVLPLDDENAVADSIVENGSPVLSRYKMPLGIKAQSATILLVEDYEGNIVVLSYILDELGCRYDIARTGREAVELWNKNDYNIILMDIQMPEMDGFSATRCIRRLEKEHRLPHTPIIGMTAHALVGDKDKCIQSGMDSYLPKPIVETDLKQQILKYLAEIK